MGERDLREYESFLGKESIRSSKFVSFKQTEPELGGRTLALDSDSSRVVVIRDIDKLLSSESQESFLSF